MNDLVNLVEGRIWSSWKTRRRRKAHSLTAARLKHSGRPRPRRSFWKNLGAYGDAGAITTNDEGLARRLRKLRDHVYTSKYLHDSIGCNYRMDGIQGFALRPGGFKTIMPSNWTQPVYHLYVVQCSSRDEVQSALSSSRIDSGVHYPVPLHRQESFSATEWVDRCL